MNKFSIKIIMSLIDNTLYLIQRNIINDPLQINLKNIIHLRNLLHHRNYITNSLSNRKKSILQNWINSTKRKIIKYQRNMPYNNIMGHSINQIPMKINN